MLGKVQATSKTPRTSNKYNNNEPGHMKMGIMPFVGAREAPQQLAVYTLQSIYNVSWSY